MQEIPALYDVARQVCHEHGMPWTDPRTGETYPAPKTAQKSPSKPRKKRGLRAKKRR